MKRKINELYQKLECNITAIYKQFLKVKLEFVVANGQNCLKPDVCSMFIEVPTIASASNMCFDLERVIKMRIEKFSDFRGKSQIVF